MRDWILVLAPVAAIVYFLANPDQFKELVAWLQTVFFHDLAGARRHPTTRRPSRARYFCYLQRHHALKFTRTQAMA
jgi:hypothetical protein